VWPKPAIETPPPAPSDSGRRLFRIGANDSLLVNWGYLRTSTFSSRSGCYQEFPAQGGIHGLMELAPSFFLLDHSKLSGH